MTRLALLAALLTACVNPPKFNGIESHGDAGAADAAPEMGDATVLATMRNGSESPQPGVHVVFTDAFGTITYEADTDGTGIAVGPAVEGGTLFAAYASPPVLVVITKIKPGETYRLGEPRYALQPRTPAASMSLTKYSTSQLYRGMSRCGSGTVTSATAAVTMVFTWTEGCSSGETVGVMATAADSDGSPIVSKYVEVAYPAATIANTGAFVPPASVALALTQPLDLASIYPTVSAVDHAYLFGGPESPTVQTNGTTASLPYFPAAAADPLQLTVDLHGVPNKGAMTYYGHLAPQTSNVSVDLSPTARPPYIYDVTLPTDDAPAFSWTATPGQPAQLALLDLVLSRPGPVPTATATIRYVFEPTESQLAPPAIPVIDSFAAFQPVVGDVPAAHVRYVRFPEGTVDYAVARQLADRTLFVNPAYPLLGLQLLAVPAVSAAFVATSQ